MTFFAYKYIAIFAIYAKMRVDTVEYLRGHVGAASNHIHYVMSPIGDDKGAININWVLVIDGLPEMFKPPMYLDGSGLRGMFRIERHREDMDSSGLQGPAYFSECQLRMQYVLEDILRDDYVELPIRERLPLQILGYIGTLVGADGDIGIILTADVTEALLGNPF